MDFPEILRKFKCTDVQPFFFMAILWYVAKYIHRKLYVVIIACAFSSSNETVQNPHRQEVIY